MTSSNEGRGIEGMGRLNVYVRVCVVARKYDVLGRIWSECLLRIPACGTNTRALPTRTLRACA